MPPSGRLRTMACACMLLSSDEEPAPVAADPPLLACGQDTVRYLSPCSRKLICCMPGWVSRASTCSVTRFHTRILPVSDDTM
uniref:Putative secreted protein n=1 Tax=Anopheles darlingi TaxID=43151 RepID=A0A2M4DEJ4_ANODA